LNCRDELGRKLGSFCAIPTIELQGRARQKIGFVLHDPDD
jgi:hypothetical protein